MILCIDTERRNLSLCVEQTRRQPNKGNTGYLQPIKANLSKGRDAKPRSKVEDNASNYDSRATEGRSCI